MTHPLVGRIDLIGLRTESIGTFPHSVGCILWRLVSTTDLIQLTACRCDGRFNSIAWYRGVVDFVLLGNTVHSVFEENLECFLCVYDYIWKQNMVLFYNIVEASYVCKCKAMFMDKHRLMIKWCANFANGYISAVFKLRSSVVCLQTFCEFCKAIVLTKMTQDYAILKCEKYHCIDTFAVNM